MTEGGNNGDGSNSLTPEQEQALQQQFQQLVQGIATEVKGFSPHLDDEMCLKSAEKSLQLQSELQQFIASALNTEQWDARPKFGVQLLQRDKKHLAMLCQKRIRDIESADEMILYLATVGLMLYPGLRAMLIANGWFAHYMEAKAPSPIIQP